MNHPEKSTTSVPVYLLLLVLLILVGVEIALISGNSRLMLPAAILSFLCTIGGLIIMLIQGSLIRNKRIMRLGRIIIGFLFIGIILKIQHLPGANIVMPCVLMLITALYGVHFFQKKKIGRTDVLKLTWVIIACTGGYFALLHLPYSWYIQLTGSILFIILFADFTLTTIVRTGNKRINLK